MSRKPNNHTGLKMVLLLLILAMIGATVYVIGLCLGVGDGEVEPRPSDVIQLPTAGENREETIEAPTETTAPAPERVAATASIAAQGDLLMHMPVFDDHVKYNSAVQLADGSYDFTPVFEHLMETTRSYDYAVANLETTFGGDDYPYQGNPTFNCPDALMDTLVEAGYDMLLTANNHSSDTLIPGIKRTLEVVRGKGVETLGTRLSDEEARYSVVDVNGIKIGMVCYTFTTSMKDGKPRLNGGLPLEQPELINYFTYGDLEGFYGEMAQIVAAMEAEGAEATMLYIHWGDEYYLEENYRQNDIAQKMCDMGIDVIVGGHPHVVQPMELLESTVDPDHKTICIYSVGNVVSNQRLGNISQINTPHTEDGALFSVTFEKYTDGRVYVAEVDVLPTWVNMYRNENDKTVYAILPLEEERREEWAELFDLPGAILTAAENSYDRTMKIVGEGLSQCQTYLEQQKLAREAYYFDLAAGNAA